MRLMNAELSESLKKFPLYSQDGKKADAVVVANSGQVLLPRNRPHMVRHRGQAGG